MLHTTSEHCTKELAILLLNSVQNHFSQHAYFFFFFFKLRDHTSRSIPKPLLTEAQTHARAAGVVEAREVVKGTGVQLANRAVAHAAQLVHLWEVEPDVA